MNESWIRGSLGDRVVLRWNKADFQASAPIEIFKELGAARKILILPNDRVGGLFIGASLYRVIRQAYPEARIALLSDGKKAALASQIPFIDEVITGEPNKPIWSASFKRLAAELRQKRFDLSLCPGPDCSFRLAYLSGVCGACVRIGFQRPGLTPYNLEVVSQRRGIYEGEQYLNMLRLFGLERKTEVKWTLVQDDAQQIRARYLGEGFSQDEIVGIDLAPGEGKGLSERQFEDIVVQILEGGARAVLFFSVAEKKQVGYLKETYGERVLPFEQNDLLGVAALMEGCAALISCNTDLLHLGIALQVPVVGIFAEDPHRWIADQDKGVRVIQVEDWRSVDPEQIVEALGKVPG